MAAIKTAISIDEELFRQVEILAHELHLSRSQIFALAAEELMEKQKNRALLDKLNEVYGVPTDATEAELTRKTKRRHARLLKGSW